MSNDVTKHPCKMASTTFQHHAFIAGCFLPQPLKKTIEIGSILKTPKNRS